MDCTVQYYQFAKIIGASYSELGFRLANLPYMFIPIFVEFPDKLTMGIC
jgi:hypothetical protein